MTVMCAVHHIPANRCGCDTMEQFRHAQANRKPEPMTDPTTPEALLTDFARTVHATTGDECPWCLSRDHWAGQVSLCPAPSSAAITRALARPSPQARGTDWFAGDVDCDGNELTAIRTDELQRPRDDRDKFKWQVRDTCRRAETAEAKLETIVGLYGKRSVATSELLPADEQPSEIGAAMSALAEPRVPSEADGWQPIETAVLWDVAIVTDGEDVALAQLAESDGGENYWAVDPEDGLDWEPTHWIAPPAIAALQHGKGGGHD